MQLLEPLVHSSQQDISEFQLSSAGITATPWGGGEIRLKSEAGATRSRAGLAKGMRRLGGEYSKFWSMDLRPHLGVSCCPQPPGGTPSQQLGWAQGQEAILGGGV